jgi:hypothetical protein
LCDSHEGRAFYFPEFGDIDDDGDMDGDILVLRNTGSSTAPAFGAPATNPLGLSSLYRIPAPALGDLDLMVGEHDGYMEFFEDTAI